MLKWRDLGLVFEISNNHQIPLWHKSHAQAPNSVVFEDFVRVYFTGRPEIEHDGNFTSRAMFVDLIPDENFRILRVSSEPILELGESGYFDENGTYPFSVLREDSGFIAIYGGWSRGASIPFDISLGLARSEDGEKFTRVGNGPILSPTLHEPFVITSPKIRKFNNRYFLTYTAGVKWFEYEGRKEIIYKLRSAVSDDLVHWTRNGINIIPDTIGEEEAQACGDIFEDASGFHMFYCYRGAKDFRLKREESYKLGYAFSKDLVAWERNDDYLGISPTNESWDSEMCAYPNVFRFRDKFYILYLGNGTGVDGFGAKVLDGNSL